MVSLKRVFVNLSRTSYLVFQVRNREVILNSRTQSQYGFLTTMAVGKEEGRLVNLVGLCNSRARLMEWMLAQRKRREASGRSQYQELPGAASSNALIQRDEKCCYVARRCRIRCSKR